MDSHQALKDHLQEVQKFQSRLEEMSKQPVEEFLSDKKAQKLAERVLHGALEAALSAAEHALRIRNAQLPSTYGEIFSALAKQDVIPQALALKLTTLENIHHILVHKPVKDWQEVYEHVRECGYFNDFYQALLPLTRE